MSSINPLFLDSTKPVGDKVLSSVEVTHILLRDGESLFLEVIDSAGLQQKFELREITTKKSAKFKSEIWLKQEQKIRYRFVIESSGQRLYSSASREAIAGTLISERWEPCFEIPVPPKSTEEKPATRRATPTKSPKKPREIKSKASKENFSAQIFGGLKSLMDDLS